MGGPRSEESERNTTPRGLREARGEERLVLNGVRVSGGLKKSIKIVSSLTLKSAKEETKLFAAEGCQIATKMRLRRSKQIPDS